MFIVDNDETIYYTKVKLMTSSLFEHLLFFAAKKRARDAKTNVMAHVSGEK